jgi:hypothetical protein|tara:strand:- start:966 stop:1397 length:432 start_codon:yes stop_codon:yes gene_type:complete
MLSGEYFGLTTEQAPREDSKSAFGVPPPRSVKGEISAAALRTTSFVARAPPRRRFPLALRFALETNDVLNFPFLVKSSCTTFLMFLLLFKEEREEEEQKQPVKVLVVIVLLFFLSLCVHDYYSQTERASEAKRAKKRFIHCSI